MHARDHLVLCVADRFVVPDCGETIDLATGDPVELVVSTAGGPSEQARWVARCDRLAAVHQRSLAPLVDFGACGDVQRFEAWSCSGRWTGRASAAARAIHLANRFLRASGLTECDAHASRVCNRRGEPVVIPTASGGYERGLPPTSKDVLREEATFPFEALGLKSLRHAGVNAMAEILGAANETHATFFGLFGAPGSGVSTALLDLARAARLHGYVPLALRALNAHVWPLISGRSVVLIVRDQVAEGWRAFLDLSSRSPRAHVVLFAGKDDARGVRSATLDRFGASALMEAVEPRALIAAHHHRIVAAARRAEGNPARFSRLLLGAPRMHVETTPGVMSTISTISRAAERAAFYGAEDGSAPISRRPSGEVVAIRAAKGWPAREELALLRKTVGAAVAQIARGRHAPGERTLRQAIGGLSRRGDHLHAAAAANALADALIRRGRSRDAHALIQETRLLAQSPEEHDVALQAAVLSGTASIERARLDEAETVLRAAVATARGLERAVWLRQSQLALSLCLFWRGQFAEAAAALSSLDRGGLEVNEADAAQVCIAASRTAVGNGDLARAVSQSGCALDLAVRSGGPALVAAAAYAAAFAHLAVSDYAAVGRDVRMSIEAARRAHDPLLSLRARLIRAESERRQGHRTSASAFVRRLRRMPPGLVPPLVRACGDLLSDLLTDQDAAGVAERHAKSSGIGGLVLFVPVRPPGVSSELPLNGVNDIVEILQSCQTAEEDTVVLRKLCIQLRAKLRAAGVAFCGGEQGELVVSDGSRVGGDIVARVRAAGQPVAPQGAAGWVEAGVPIRYGGRSVGVLAVKWTPGSVPDAPDPLILLATAATASAPALAAVSLPQLTPAVSGAPELLGISRAVEDIRRTIERAASAPFPVLIEGESGSGKELVARALHRCGPRRQRPLCALNCAALPDDLVESELFGHARGAFTGAALERPGVFEEAHGGTLFLDEIGELSLRAQAKVLRAIQESEVRRVGENISRRVDVRVMAATNRNLRRDVEAGRFRLDLLYRLDIIRIAIPPLRDRREDIAVLAEPIWREAAARVGSRATLSAATIAALARYDWPGNVRELQNVLAALAVRSSRRGVVPPDALPPHFESRMPDGSWRLDQARRQFEDRFVRAALARCGGQRTRAAEELGLTRQGLSKLIARLSIE